MPTPIWQIVHKAYQRFPLAVFCLSAFILNVLANGQSFLEFSYTDIVGYYLNTTITYPLFWDWFFLASIGVVWFVAVALATESHTWTASKWNGLAVVVYAMYVGYYFNGDLSAAISAQTVLLGLAVSISFAPWCFRRADNAAYWRFNRELVYAIFISCFRCLLILLIPIFILFVLSFSAWPWLYWLCRTLLIIGFGFALPLSCLGTIPAPQDNQNESMAAFDKERFVITALFTSVGFGLVVFALLGLGHVDISFTEKEYKWLILLSWIVLVTVFYFAGNRWFQLQTIPQILALLCLFVSFGPWQIGRLPAEIQFKQLERLLENEQLILDGSINRLLLLANPN